MGKSEGETGAQSLDERTVEFAVTLFAALAHPTRLRMVGLLMERGYTVTEVAEALEILQPNASQHLAILLRAGIVIATPVGAARCYELRGPRITRILRLVNEVRAAHADTLQKGSALEE